MAYRQNADTQHGRTMQRCRRTMTPAMPSGHLAPTEFRNDSSMGGTLALRFPLPCGRSTGSLVKFRRGAVAREEKARPGPPGPLPAAS